ncbi:hypothetical protein N1027_08090 [Herbiconiux sp. CPCC 205763]|uniref:Uncharacterized protein n=1 Tax=Herbiconiux aconitum TaxID=2970913 RepID=A0ABT2GS22_9MICO|nr:hypothetical protein [Herbiconiux aconitum]MCS5718095.1 hypothetical protein [Herbiconiux aconitum]
MSGSRSGESPLEKKSFNERLRARYFGRRRPDPEHADAPVGYDGPAESVLPKSNQMGFFGRVQRPGGFDTPPEEPVELEGPLPWELGGEAPDSPDSPAK